MRVKLQRFQQMLRHKRPVVLSRIDVSNMRHMAHGEQLIQLTRACIKTKIVMVAASNVDFQAIQVCDPGKDKRRVRFPEGFIQGTAEGATEESSKPCVVGPARKPLQQRRHKRAGGDKHLWVLEGEAQR